VHAKLRGLMQFATRLAGFKVSLKQPKVLAPRMSRVNLRAGGSSSEIHISPNNPPNGILVSNFVEAVMYSPGKSSVASGGLISVKGATVSRVCSAPVLEVLQRGNGTLLPHELNN
jgi:hypothetical protein